MRWPSAPAPVLDYATKLCLAAPVSGTQAARDAVGAIKAAMAHAETVLGHPLIEDCADRTTGEIHPVVIVTDIQTQCCPFRSLDRPAGEARIEGAGAGPPSLGLRAERIARLLAR